MDRYTAHTPFERQPSNPDWEEYLSEVHADQLAKRHGFRNMHEMMEAEPYLLPPKPCDCKHPEYHCGGSWDSEVDQWYCTLTSHAWYEPKVARICPDCGGNAIGNWHHYDASLQCESCGLAFSVSLRPWSPR